MSKTSNTTFTPSRNIKFTAAIATLIVNAALALTMNGLFNADNNGGYGVAPLATIDHVEAITVAAS
jgi:uncharacterized protein (DUF736 family)